MAGKKTQHVLIVVSDDEIDPGGLMDQPGVKHSALLEVESAKNGEFFAAASGNLGDQSRTFSGKGPKRIMAIVAMLNDYFSFMKGESE